MLPLFLDCIGSCTKITALRTDTSARATSILSPSIANESAIENSLSTVRILPLSKTCSANVGSYVWHAASAAAMDITRTREPFPDKRFIFILFISKYYNLSFYINLSTRNPVQECLPTAAAPGWTAQRHRSAEAAPR